MTDDFTDEILRRAGLGVTLYRVGTPSIGETWGRRWNSSRGTGGYGTGVYAFTTREAAERNVSQTPGEREVVVLENALMNPIRPADFQTTVALNDLGREMARVTVRVRGGESTFDSERDDPDTRLRRKARNVLFDTPEFRDRFGFDTDQFVTAAIDAAEEAAAARDSPESRTATQPMNALLHPDFDGVYPRGEAGESGTYGAVILKEKVDECLGRVTREGGEIESETLNDCFRQNL